MHAKIKTAFDVPTILNVKVVVDEVVVDEVVDEVVVDDVVDDDVVDDEVDDDVVDDEVEDVFYVKDCPLFILYLEGPIGH